MKDSILRLHLQLLKFLQMAEEGSNTLATIHSINNSNQKTDIDVKKEKKKKMAAFKTFLDNKIEVEPLQDIPKRKLSQEQNANVKTFNQDYCKICNEAYNQPKLCQFCKQKVCLAHVRKRRRNPETNKFGRICQYCEDRYLIEKYFQNEMKTQQSLISEQIVIQKKYNELRQLLESKKIKLKKLQNKKIEFENQYKKQSNLLSIQQNDLDKKMKKIDNSRRQNNNLQFLLLEIEKKLPQSLQVIYEQLVQQNTRMTKDLVKYEKMCNDVVKATKKRQKDMYRQYYEWQEKKKLQQIQEIQKDKQDCVIY